MKKIMTLKKLKQDVEKHLIYYLEEIKKNTAESKNIERYKNIVEALEGVLLTTCNYDMEKYNKKITEIKKRLNGV